MPSYEYQVFAGFQQFYLMVDGMQPLFFEKATAGDCRWRIKAAPHMVVVSSVRNAMVPVKIDVLGAEPPLDLAPWDHIVECSLEVTSGCIVVAGCTDYLPHCARFELRPDTYRTRVLYGALEQSSDDGANNEHYRISVWPAPAGELHVIKQYEQAAAMCESSESPVAQALFDESLYKRASESPISPRRQACADWLGVVVALSAGVFFFSIEAGLEAIETDAPAAGLPILVGMVLTLPPAILCTGVALLLVGVEHAKLAWMSLCLFLLPVLYAVGMALWASVWERF